MAGFGIGLVQVETIKSGAPAIISRTPSQKQRRVSKGRPFELAASQQAPRGYAGNEQKTDHLKGDILFYLPPRRRSKAKSSSMNKDL